MLPIKRKSSGALKALKEFWMIYKKQKIGLVGLGMLVVLLILAAIAPVISSPDTLKHWRDSAYWSDNPRLAPPAWIGIFEDKAYAKQEVITFDVSGVGPTIHLRVEYNYVYDVPPKAIKIKINATALSNTLVNITLTVTRPDGESFVLLNDTERVAGSSFEINIPKDRGIKKTLILKAYEWGDTSVEEYLINPESALISHERLMYILFSRKGDGMSLPDEAKPLKGKYIFEVKLEYYGEMADQAKVNKAVAIIQASAYGLLGTDDLGEDLFVLIVWGVRPALLIGILSSLISAIIGLIYGTISAYYEGKVGEILRRINDIFYVLPVLPILLMLSYSVKYTRGGYVGLWMLTILIAVFSWPSMAVVIRSMALQVKQEEFVEAAKAAGASDFVIIFRHIMPQLLPYVFANIALGVPAAILTEAGISFLGLGDPTSPTWGQILHYAQRKGGVKYWWWVIPPGLMISFVGLSFAFIGMALDRVLNPRLREH